MLREVNEVNFLKIPEAVKTRFNHLLEGVNHFSNDPRLNQLEQNKMAILLDNLEMSFCQKNQIPREALQEAMTTNTAISQFNKIMLPIVRKVYPDLISRELVSVQPMSLPVTKAFYYDVLRDDATSLSSDIHTQRTYADNVEYNPLSPQAIKEITLSMTSQDVTATEKKLKAKHTIEVEQDLFAYFGIQASSELSFHLGAEITREWDRIILQDLLDTATGGSATFDQTTPVGISYTDRKVWMEMLYEKMIDVDTLIYTKRYKKTNWIVFPPTVAGFLEKLSGFKCDETANVSQKIIATGGRYFMGTLNNRWRCYCDPFFPSNKILMGYNNAHDWADTSYVWCPYILSYFSDPFVDNDTLVKSQAILSRAGQKSVVGDLRGYVTITGS